MNKTFLATLLLIFSLVLCFTFSLNVLGLEQVLEDSTLEISQEITEVDNNLESKSRFLSNDSPQYLNAGLRFQVKFKIFLVSKLFNFIAKFSDSHIYYFSSDSGPPLI